MNINLLKLQIVEQLEQHKKVTAVAEILGIKQPTVTFHMKSLEQELGVQLFELRSGKTVLTEAGRAFHHYAAKINALAQEAERVAKEYQNLERGSLNIGASYVPGTYMLPGVISRFLKTHPKITLHLSVKTAPVIKDMLINHKIDIGIFSAENIQLPPLVSETLCEDELVVIFNPAHKLARHQQLYPDMLRDIPFIYHSMESSTREMTDKWSQNNGIPLNPVMEIDSLEAIKEVVMRGDCISFISRLAVEREAERNELAYQAIPQNHFKRYISFAFNSNRRLSTLMQAFIDYLQ